MITGISIIVRIHSINSHTHAEMFQVVSYVIIGALADAFPTTTHFNKGGAIVQVIFIFVIEMVRSSLFRPSTPGKIPTSLTTSNNCQAYSGALGPCAWIYASKIFPNEIRDKGVNISQAGQQMTTLWINQAWPVMFDNVGHNAYWILMSINIIGLFVVILFWPETKGISLEHMDKLFGQLDKVEAYKAEHGGIAVAQAGRILKKGDAVEVGHVGEESV